MPKQKTDPLFESITIADLEQVAASAATMLDKARRSMFAPNAVKAPPSYSASQLAGLIGATKSRFQYLLNKADAKPLGGLPVGAKIGQRRMWSLQEARQWVRSTRGTQLRNPAVSSAVVITVANFKGGVSKTTTAAVLAQGLSLRGHKVLVIDTDPQGSLTTLFGVLPDTEVTEEQTILPLIAGEVDSILPAVQPTYWDGVDLVAGAQTLFNVDFLLPVRQQQEGGQAGDFQFWRVLDKGLDEAREVYDVIIIDTPPALSYITVNAVFAAQGLIMPLLPNALDFASSAQFWGLINEVCGDMETTRGAVPPKTFAFIDVLLSRVSQEDVVSKAVKEWIRGAYGSKVMNTEIPKTAIAATASAAFGTVYDMDSSSTKPTTLKRAKDAYDAFVEQIEFRLAGIWAADELLLGKETSKVST